MASSSSQTTALPPPLSASPGGDPVRTSKFYRFPASYSLQPVLGTRASQLGHWSAFVQRYCRFHRQWRVSPDAAVSTPLFRNAELGKGLTRAEAAAVLEHMCSDAGGRRAEWTGPERTTAWVYWRKPEEWADVLARWVDDTGQKGVVLTLYELAEGEATVAQDFYGMPPDLLKKALAVLVRNGHAQIFGAEGEQGVKFF